MGQLGIRDPMILGSAEESADLIGRCFGKDASAKFFHLSALNRCFGCNRSIGRLPMHRLFADASDKIRFAVF